MGDAYRVSLNWPLGGVRAVFNLEDPSHLWGKLEAILGGQEAVNWSEMRRTPRHLQKQPNND